MRVAIASDHAAVALKATLADWLREAGHDVIDLGTDGNASVDYPDYGFAIAEALAAGARRARCRAVRLGDRDRHRRQPASGMPLRAGERAAFRTPRAQP